MLYSFTQTALTRKYPLTLPNGIVSRELETRNRYRTYEVRLGFQSSLKMSSSVRAHSTIVYALRIM